MVVNSTEIAFRQTIADEEKTLKQRRGYAGKKQSIGFMRKRRIEGKGDMKGIADALPLA